MAGKGDTRRPLQITQAENDLRWLLAEGKISKSTYNRRWNKLKKAGLIQRSGIVIND